MLNQDLRIALTTITFQVMPAAIKGGKDRGKCLSRSCSGRDSLGQNFTANTLVEYALGKL